MCRTHDSLTARGLLISEEAEADKVTTKIGSTCFTKTTCTYLQRPKKSKISGRQTFMRKNFPDEARKSFPRHICQMFVNRFCNINAKSSFLIIFLQTLLVANFSDIVHAITYFWRLQIGCKPSRLSRNFPGCPKTFQIG